jgi:hypothetical protein
MSNVPYNVPINDADISSIDQPRPTLYNTDPFRQNYGNDNFFIQPPHHEEQDSTINELLGGDDNTDLGPIQGPMLPDPPASPQHLDDPTSLGNSIQIPDGPMPSHMIINSPSAYNPNSLHIFRRVIPCPSDIPVVEAEPVTLKCCICMTNQVNTMLEPCCHASMCGVCAEEYVRRDHVCPTCRRPIIRVHRMYLSYNQHVCPGHSINSINRSSSLRSSSEQSRKKRKDMN